MFNADVKYCTSRFVHVKITPIFLIKDKDVSG